MSAALLVPPVLALAVAWIVCRVLVAKARVLDVPGERSLHSVPTPRTGGLGIAAGVAVGVAVLLVLGGAPAGRLLPLLVMAAVAAAVSLADDLYRIPAAIRLFVHAVAAVGWVAWSGTRLESIALPGPGAVALGAAGGVAAVLFIVWSANLYNFMDGMDGLAGGMAAAGFAGLAYLLHRGGQPALAGAALVVAGAALGFLGHNLPPARLFMGDVGSIPLGFLAAALSLEAVRSGVVDVWGVVLLFGPFWADASWTLLKRILRGKRVWEAHREHAYQRAVLAGASRRGTLAAEYGLMVLCGAGTMAGVVRPEWRGAILVAAGAVFAAALLVVRRREARKPQVP